MESLNSRHIIECVDAKADDVEDHNALVKAGVVHEELASHNLLEVPGQCPDT